jgi:hypothetical protein
MGAPLPSATLPCPIATTVSPSFAWRHTITSNEWVDPVFRVRLWPSAVLIALGSLISRTVNRARAVWRYLASAPLTFSWLAVLLATTIYQHSVPRAQRRMLLLHGSTNLHHLASDPIRVLFDSLLWIDSYRWWPYLLVFVVFLAPAERWLGSVRWLIVGLVAHICATYISEGVVYWRIQEAMASPRLINARDIGVSYFVVGILGVLTYHIARPWRWGYLAVAVLVFVVALIISPNFTPFGHFFALLIGLSCYPLVRGRDRAPADPGKLFRWLTHREAPAA